MHRILVSVLAFAACVCVGALPAVAQSTVAQSTVAQSTVAQSTVAQSEPPHVSTAPVEESAEQQYRDAVALLRNGRKFEAAIAKLRNAARQAPDSSPHHLALGCALTSRAVSIADAARQATEYPGKLSDYNDAVALWEAAQKQRGTVLYGQPSPFPPIIPTTKDDGKAFKLSKERSEQSYDALGREAIREWEAGRKAARTDEEKAQACLLTGWGKSLLRVGSLDLKPSAELQKEVARSKCTDAANAAVALLPNDPAMWRGVGDIALFDFYADKSGTDFQYNKEAAQAYERSLALNKKALDLWYVLFLMESRYDTGRAETALNHALRLDNGNAFLWYEKAYFIPHRVSGSVSIELETAADAAKMNAAQWREVLNAVERGNAVGRFQFVGISPKPTALLASAWWYCAKHESLPMYRFVTTNIYLSSIFSENIGAAKKQNDTKMGQRWSQAVLGMGQLLSHDVLSGAASPVSPAASSAVGLRAMEGKFALQQGYDGLIALQNPAGKTARTLRQEKQRVTEVIDGWSKAYIGAHQSRFSRASGQ